MKLSTLESTDDRYYLTESRWIFVTSRACAALLRNIRVAGGRRAGLGWTSDDARAEPPALTNLDRSPSAKLAQARSQPESAGW
jgi:hypothetical protein